jgi:hypothetical protein
LLRWTAGAPPVEQLRARGVLVLEWAAWRREAAAWLRPGAHDDRQTLEPPGRARLAELRGHEAVAVLGVELASLDDVRALHETLLVPVLRAGIPLLVESERTPEELDDGTFAEPGVRARLHARADALAVRPGARRRRRLRARVDATAAPAAG